MFPEFHGDRTYNSHYIKHYCGLYTTDLQERLNYKISVSEHDLKLLENPLEPGIQVVVWASSRRRPSFIGDIQEVYVDLRNQLHPKYIYKIKNHANRSAYISEHFVSEQVTDNLEREIRSLNFEIKRLSSFLKVYKNALTNPVRQKLG